MGTSCLCLTVFFFCFNANSSGIETITWGLKTFLISISSIRLCNTLMIPLISSKFSIVPPLSYHVGYDQPPPAFPSDTVSYPPPLQSPPGQFPLQGKNPKKVDKDIVHKSAHLRRFYLLQSWRNEFLTWNSSKYGDLQRVHFSPEEIWVPDTALFNK